MLSPWTVYVTADGDLPLLLWTVFGRFIYLILVVCLHFGLAVIPLYSAWIAITNHSCGTSSMSQQMVTFLFYFGLSLADSFTCLIVRSQTTAAALRCFSPWTVYVTADGDLPLLLWTVFGRFIYLILVFLATLLDQQVMSMSQQMVIFLFYFGLSLADSFT
ncbi:hypothetical protein DM01DRAFT_1369935 [Hesseltinella vesiculosa]|uniref:Uncharacterized protein n=1 Tax=Hesseltinella vesiculosa TaxID=101127 RepID=A0A1X2GVG5_9FUNG|nr:hypothetical protein DM01DRAFT_1369935 [Hesseltinella vesiculosa]